MSSTRSLLNKSLSNIVGSSLGIASIFFWDMLLRMDYFIYFQMDDEKKKKLLEQQDVLFEKFCVALGVAGIFFLLKMITQPSQSKEGDCAFKMNGWKIGIGFGFFNISGAVAHFFHGSSLQEIYSINPHQQTEEEINNLFLRINEVYKKVLFHCILSIMSFVMSYQFSNSTSETVSNTSSMTPPQPKLEQQPQRWFFQRSKPPTNPILPRASVQITRHALKDEKTSSAGLKEVGYFSSNKKKEHQSRLHAQAKYKKQQLKKKS